MTTSVPDESHAAFAVAAAAIPVGVRCRSCGRLHLPASLSPLAIRLREGGGAVVDLRCVRCNAAGSLLLDPENTDHRRLLATWLDEAGQVPGEDNSKAST